MNCPKCKENKSTIKHGFLRGLQRYLCKICNYNYTVEKRKNAKDESLKYRALELYLEGLGFISIGRLLNVSHVSVYNLIKSYGEKLEQLQPMVSIKDVKIVEIDEMHSYIGNKKSEWIWIAVDRLNKIFINCVIGTRCSKTGKELWGKISDVAVGIVMTNHCKAYNELFLMKNIFVQKHKLI